MSALDDLLAPTGKSLKFDTPGDTYTGVVTGTNVRQATEFGTGKPLAFDDGTPREQIVVTLDTELRDADDPDDDGTRSLYVKGWGPQRRAFVAAVKAAGGAPEPGDRFTVTFTGLGERPASGGFAAKLYDYTIIKTPAASEPLGGDEGAAGPDLPPWETPADPGQAAQIDTARRLAATGLMSPQQIAEATGLPLGIISAITAR